MASFPVLKTPELLVSLNDIGNTLAADDIDRPTTARVIPAYLWFWTHLTSLTMDDVRMAATLWLENMTADAVADANTVAPEAAIEMLQESVHMGVLWQTLNQMMRWAMVDDFSIRDLRDPQATRVRKILSALVNFHLFELEQLNRLSSLEEELEREEEARYNSAIELEDMRNKIAEKKIQLEKDGIRVAQLAQENAERRNKLIRAKEMEEPALQRLDAVKRTKNMLQEKIDSETLSYKHHDAEINRLRGRIVQSPDRVRRTINDLANSLQSLKDEIVEIDRKAREHEARISVARKYEGDIASVVKLLDEWSSELAKCASTSARLASLIETSDTFVSTLWSIKTMFRTVEQGFKGVAMHGGRNASYTPLLDDGIQTMLGERPLYYGLLAFNQVAKQGKLLSTTFNGASGLYAWVIRDSNLNVRCVLLNTNTEGTAEYDITWPSIVNAKAGTAILLEAPDLYSKDEVTLGGAKVDENGNWQATDIYQVSISGGKSTISVAPISAVLIEFLAEK